MLTEIPNPVRTTERDEEKNKTLEMGHMLNTRHDVDSLLFEGRGLIGTVVQAIVGAVALQADTPTKWASLVRIGIIVTMDACPPPSRYLAVAKGIPLAQHVHAPKAYA